MAFKINISEKGKTYKVESENENLIGKKIGENIQGQELMPELAGYILQISGTSDKAGFPGKKDTEGSALKRVLLKKGWGMHKRYKQAVKKGLRLRRSVRGNTISTDIVQINLIVKKQGNKKLEEIFKKEEKTEEKKEEAQ